MIPYHGTVQCGRYREPEGPARREVYWALGPDNTQTTSQGIQRNIQAASDASRFEARQLTSKLTRLSIWSRYQRHHEGATEIGDGWASKEPRYHGAWSDLSKDSRPWVCSWTQLRGSLRNYVRYSVGDGPWSSKRETIQPQSWRVVTRHRILWDASRVHSLYWKRQARPEEKPGAWPIRPSKEH